MDDWRRVMWVWKVRKWGISVFLAVHVGATVAWVLPPSPLRAAAWPVARYYIVPLGQWQYWGMFAPDPAPHSLTLEADVVDARGLRATYEFTKVADYPWWRAVPLFRHSKFAANLSGPEGDFLRQVASRHAVRRLEIPDSAFPVDVKLLYRLTPTPKPGGPAADPMTAKPLLVIGAFHFEQAEEVRR